MSKPFVRNTLNTTVENQLAIASIVSTSFLSKIAPTFDPEYIINDYVRTICKWSVDYFNKYDEAPHVNIKPIYEVEKHGLDKAESELIATVLAKLSSEYANGEGINEEYIFDNTIKYFEQRDFTIRMERAVQLRDVGRWEDAKKALESKKELEKALIKSINIFDYDEIVSTYNRESHELLKLPGALGEMIGPIERGWLIGIIGGFKRGKTMYMVELAAQAMVSKLKVVFFSLEMTDRAMKDRMYKRITGFGKGDALNYPIFDCLSNQLGICRKPERRNDIILRASIKDPIRCLPNYRICTACRGIRGSEYVPELYYEEITTEELNVKNIARSMRAFEMMFGNRIKCVCYPRFGASYDDLERDLDRFEREEDFIPDLVVSDYANIMRPGKYAAKADKIEVINDNWINLARLAGERHCAVVTGGQGTRGSLSKGQLEEGDIAEWIGILGHVDIMLALNQLAAEKEAGKIRISTLAHRHKDFNPEQNVVVLQKLDVGQTLLDSEFERR
jgi:hypothetical protein